MWMIGGYVDDVSGDGLTLIADITDQLALLLAHDVYVDDGLPLRNHFDEVESEFQMYGHFDCTWLC